MRTASTVNTSACLLILSLICYSAECAQAAADSSPAPKRSTLAGAQSRQDARSGTDAEQKAAGPSARARTSRQRANLVRTVDFHLRTGDLVFGKLVDEDRNKISVERVAESKILVSTYSKREIDSRTLQTKTVPEYKYYLDLADRFSRQTWDFRDDPDDFIQAIRCCEKAKQSMEGSVSQDAEKLAEIDKKIKKLQADREVWAREVESRAKLKKLEFEAEFEKRFDQLEEMVKTSSEKVDETVTRLDGSITEMEGFQQRLDQNLAMMDARLAQELNVMANRIEANTSLIDPFRMYLRTRRPFGYYGY
ncbi:MAG: hypothetical protein JSU70_22535 [Phycisphaerales bacterium]|nr:MAG: hypothetical protein JSU70_22535 [Phycisphaerales bacterium]